MSTSRTPRAAVLGLTVGALVAGGLVLAPAASAVSTSIVINEVYGAGGNAGPPAAVYKNDFIELKNIGTTPVSVSGWSVQYASATGATWQVTGLSGTIAPGGRYLIAESGGSNGADLPAPRTSGGIAMAAGAGKVALVNNGTALACGAVCAGTTGVVDFVGYGTTANNFEGAGRAPAPSTTLSVSRDAAGKDTDDNAADFTAGAPTPENAGVADDPPPPRVCPTGTVPIGTVQGSSAATPCAGEKVTVEGTVVADLQDTGFKGFYLQDDGDDDTATSDGVFVYTPSGNGVAVGDVVTVSGTVKEFRNLTELDFVTVTKTGTAPVPAATPLPLPSTDTQREALEGMLVAPEDGLTVTEMFDLDFNGQILLAAGGRLISPTEAAEPGAASTAVAVANAQRSIALDDANPSLLNGAAPPYLTLDDPVRVGDTAHLESVVLSQDGSSYLLEPADGTTAGNTFDATNPRPATPGPVGGDLTIADFNVLNYFVDTPDDITSPPPAGEPRGATTPEELEEQETKIVAAMKALDADIFTLHEIENSAIYTPATPYRAVETLIAALEDADGHQWDYVRAHEDTDAITNAIIYRTDVAIPAGPPLVYNGPEFANARSPIGQTFRTGDETFSIIANHLKSKGSPCTTGNDTSVGGSGSCNADRVAQAHALVAFAETVKEQSGDADILLTGDFNAYRYEDPIDVVTGAGYTDMGPLLAPDQYSYVFDGGSGSLDHVFASPSVQEKLTGLAVWDINAVESFAYEYDADYEGLYAPYPYRASDHNPTLFGMTTEIPATATISGSTPRRGDRVTVTGTAFDAGTTVKATLPSENGAVLGTGVADANGTVTITFTVPDLVHKGSYQVDLTAADGEKASTSFTLRPRGQDVADRAHERNNGGN